MNHRLYAQWRLGAEVWLWRHGWGWAVVTLLAVVCVLAWAFVFLPLQAHLAQVEAEHGEHLSRAEAPAAPPGRENLQRIAWQELSAALPHEKQADRLIARTLALARQHGVVLQQADYQYQLDAEMKWMQMNMSLPVRGSYPQTRRFIEAVLREHPHLAMNQIGFKRDGAASAQLEAIVSFSAWFMVGEVGR